MLPRGYHWDLSRYEWRGVTPRNVRHADRTTDPNDPCDGYRSLTRTMWCVIRERKSTRWAGAKRRRAAHKETEEMARGGRRKREGRQSGWAAVQRRHHIFADDKPDAVQLDSPN
jgi:hypothetical protein